MIDKVYWTILPTCEFKKVLLPFFFTGAQHGAYLLVIFIRFILLWKRIEIYIILYLSAKNQHNIASKIHFTTSLSFAIIGARRGINLNIICFGFLTLWNVRIPTLIELEFSYRFTRSQHIINTENSFSTSLFSLIVAQRGALLWH